MQRKDFIKLGAVIAATASQSAVYAAENINRPKNFNPKIDFIQDGLFLTPKEYAGLLMKLADEGKIKPDFYSNGGVVEEMEAKLAKLMGKESAVFMPTGTLANHIAIRHLAGNNKKVIVQEQSHFYNDCGDCSQTLSGLNLIPVAENLVGFSVRDVENIIEKTKKGRVETRVGVISIESPVRRQHDQMVSFNTMKAISDYAKTNEIKMHLDGARLFVQAVHDNIEPAKYGEVFDTVYTSLWKCFNAASGAVLAGSRSFTEKLFHERRMFGSGLPAAWPFAAVALHFADSFTVDYKKAWKNAEILFLQIEKDERFKIIKYENGSHIVRLEIKNTNLIRFKEALAKNNIELGAADQTGFFLKINPSITNVNPEEIVDSFKAALKVAS